MKDNEVYRKSTTRQVVLSCPKVEFDDDDYRLELAIALRRKYSGRWAAEKWLLHRYFRRWLSILVRWLSVAKTAKRDTGTPPILGGQS